MTRPASGIGETTGAPSGAYEPPNQFLGQLLQIEAEKFLDSVRAA